MVNPFVSREVWDRNAGDVDESLFIGGKVYAGLDLSVRNDLTALALIVQDAEANWHVRMHFYCPLNGIQERARRDRVPYDLWAEQGWLTATPGSSVDYEVIAERLCDISEECELQKVAFDRYRMKEMEACLSRLGRELPLEPFGQGFVSMAPALDSLESELLNARVRHGNNPVLRMCAVNAVATKDPAGNRKLDKSKATGRIDGMVALVMAMGVAKASGESVDISGFLTDMIVI
jgi:phage terminase large subunit-like protein